MANNAESVCWIMSDQYLGWITMADQFVHLHWSGFYGDLQLLSSSIKWSSYLMSTVYTQICLSSRSLVKTITLRHCIPQYEPLQIGNNLTITCDKCILRSDQSVPITGKIFCVTHMFIFVQKCPKFSADSSLQIYFISITKCLSGLYRYLSFLKSHYFR